MRFEYVPEEKLSDHLRVEYYISIFMCYIFTISTKCIHMHIDIAVSLIL